MGVHDLEHQSSALCLRWQWLSRTDCNRAWSGLDLQLTPEEGDLFASAYTEVGDGLTAKFWEDQWIQGRSIRDIVPLLFDCIPK